MTTMTIPQALAIAVDHHRAGRTGEAAAIYRRILAVQPRHPDALHLLGVSERQTGNPLAAVRLIGQALAIAPGLPGIGTNLEAAVRDALAVAMAAHQGGDVARADTVYAAILEVLPDHPEALHLSGMAAFQRGDARLALERIDRAIARDGSVALHHVNRAHVLKAEGDIDAATASLDRALELRPGDIEILLRQAMTQLPSIHADAAELATRRAAYAARLRALHDRCLAATPEERAAGAAAVGIMQPYLLPYQAGDDRELQRLYGETVCRLMAARHPQWSRPLPMPPRDPDGRLRIGIVSAHFYGHSVWKIPVKGWVEHLPRDRFRLIGYSLTTRPDTCTLDARRLFDRFVEGLPGLEALAAAIRADEPHVLLYPEIGMDPPTARLSALRLAPVQAVSLGHPETTGQPTIDHYLSSDLMEPPDGAAAYTETLVRLPNLAVCYEPLAIPDAPLTRGALGLREEAVLYWCCQFMPKYLPQYDQVFARIASALTAAGRDCQFVFISNMSSGNRATFEARLDRAFTAEGLDRRRHCAVLPWLGAREFTAAIRLMDVFLDSIGWSGNNTTMESLHGDLPVVTFPQAFMRGRHAYGILRLLGVEDTVARSLDDYVDIAVRLGLDRDWRLAVSGRMRAAKPRAYGDRACIDGLTDYLLSVTAAAPPAHAG